MNARFATKVRVGLTMTVLALGGAMALSGNTGCAGSDSSSGGTTSNGGSAGGAGGSSTTPSNGGQSGSGSCTAGEDSVCFAAGKASGVMKGYGYIALGASDTATSPVCDNTANGGTASESITSAKPCPEAGGKSVWSTPDVGLCISGSIPMVTGGDYTGNWGLQIGCNVSDPAGTAIETAYSKITFNFSDAGVNPKNTDVRGELHIKGDDSGKTYCATVTSGAASSLIAFNTACWDGSGDNLTADKIPNIDKIGIQLSSSDKKSYEVKDFCWTGLSFTK
jgi:hypothetical protein